MNWESVHSPPVNVFGAASASLDGDIYIIGGSSAGRSDSNHLSVHCFDSFAAALKNTVVNTCGVANRSHHTVSALASHAYILGGELSDGTLTSEVVKCSVNDEGFSARVVRHSGLGRTGMMGAAAGPCGHEVTVIFGGFDGTTYFDDIILLTGDISEESPLQVIPILGDKPTARAFGACSVFGENNEFMVLSGGYNGTEVFGDVWVLDITKSIPALSSVADAAPTKGAKAGKGAVLDEPMKWTKLSAELYPKRFYHTSYTFRQNNGSYTYRVAGGLNQTGHVSTTPVECTIAVTEGSAPSDNGPFSSLSETDTFAPRYGGIIAPIKENNAVIGAFLFGGISSHGNSDIGFNSADDSSELSRQLRRTLDQRVADILAAEAAAAEENNENTNTKVSDVIEYPNGDRYDGEVHRGPEVAENSVPDGQGSMYYADGSVYEGLWEMGVRSGRGRLTLAEGTVYEGSFSKDNFNGNGKYTIAPSGELFEGNFVNNSLEGNGCWQDQVGNIYEGDFEGNLKHGQGTLYSLAGAGHAGERTVVYSGQWAHGKPFGIGTLNFMVEGEGMGGALVSVRYEGEVRAGLPHGTGDCFYSNGAFYSGQWRKRMRNGFGKYISPNGDEYDGKWVADKRCGKGVWKSFRGDRYSGQWEFDVPHGQGEYCYASGAVFAGDWERGKCHGNGKMVYADSSEYSGHWKNGAWHGIGDWEGPVRSDGEVAYSGEWVDGMRSGSGTATYSSGDQYTGRFINDKPSSSKQ